MVLLDHGDHVRGHSVGRAQLELPVGLVKHVDHAGLGAGKLRRLGDNGVEHGLQVERRVDRLGDFAERAQLLDRLRELARARLHLVEQPHVLDRDHRLVGKGGDQLDLLVGERPHRSCAAATMTPIGRSFAQQRDTEHGAEAADLLSLQLRVFRISQHIGNVNDLAFEQRSPDDAVLAPARARCA